MSKQNLHKSLGTYLKDKRTRLGLTQAEVAKKLNYASPQFISNFERGLCSPPLKNLKVLVKLYEIPANELMDLMVHEYESLLQKALGIKSKK